MNKWSLIKWAQKEVWVSCYSSLNILILVKKVDKTDTVIHCVAYSISHIVMVNLQNKKECNQIKSYVEETTTIVFKQVTPVSGLQQLMEHTYRYLS